MFNNSGNINDDSSDLTQSNVQSIQNANYMLSNNIYSNNTFGSAMHNALAQPYLFVRGNSGASNAGTNIEDSNKLMIGQEQTRAFERLNIKPRMFNSIPFMGRGKVDSDVESAMLQSGPLPEKKSDVALSEQDYTALRNYPLIPSIEETIANPTNLVEEAADSGWQRGGMASRNLAQQR